MTTIPVIIDRSSPVPLYHQLAEQLTAVIEDGTLKPGDAFENELALADRLDLSRPTVRRAIAELVGRGLSCVAGSGDHGGQPGDPPQGRTHQPL